MKKYAAVVAALAMQIAATQLSADRGDCNALQEAIVCDARSPWKRVTEFPYAQFQLEPAGWAVVFHLDGRGVGIVQSLEEIETPDAGNAQTLADYWTENFVDGAGIVLTSQWTNSEGQVDGVRSIDRMVTFEKDGRTTIMRGSFVSTVYGDLMIYSFLNEVIDSQGGDFLHRGLISSVSLR